MNLEAQKIKESQEKFLKEVCETNIVWVLEKDEEFATSFSGQYEGENGDPAEILCVWSDSKSAEACAQEDWEGYKASQISLSDFIGKWCLGIADDGIMAGLNLDTELIGAELDPLELILELSNELKKQKKSVTIDGYASLADLVKEVKEVLGEE